MTYLVAFAFIAILGSLGSALYFMMKDGRGGKAKTSTWHARWLSVWGFPSCCLCVF
jgi:hypothetical protein